MSVITSRRMLKLQAKLNAIFVHKRNSGASTASIYSQLKRVEQWLSERNIYW